MKAVLEYWHSLKEQEQKLLMFGGGIFVIFIFVMGVWRPLNQAIESSSKDLQKQQALSAWMQTSIAKIKQANPKASISSGSLSQIVNTTRNRYQITLSKMQPKDNTLRLTIENVEFNKLVEWLTLLVQKHNVSIENIDMSKDDNTGYVKVSRLILEK
ncbi:type II secretion system protein GspM [Pseudoalteromonas denitrificans]|jgi:general secretion pathway protein M|uniref:Type II secretion system protein M n=1 Tax=Pseudoalteromonas denitrificans DSM 6059 TaxID=1123010 RepID=A0A1I1QGT7_9GAMM|nr:type II secretion system protein M [Pseudoalteromonas denitrificans]SFD21217.1 general secretion pathway protein M [Pseudoalteromonas denitrificans DSM 6059]